MDSRYRRAEVHLLGIFGKKPLRSEQVRFVYLTAQLARAAEIQRLAGSGCWMTAAAETLHSALEEAERTKARVLLIDYERPGATCREVVNACKDAVHPLAVVVILDSFDGLKWLDIICTRVYDIVLRSALRESLGHMLASAHLYAASSGLMSRAR